MGTKAVALVHQMGPTRFVKLCFAFHLVVALEMC